MSNAIPFLWKVKQGSRFPTEEDDHTGNASVYLPKVGEHILSFENEGENTLISVIYSSDGTNDRKNTTYCTHEKNNVRYNWKLESTVNDGTESVTSIDCGFEDLSNIGAREIQQYVILAPDFQNFYKDFGIDQTNQVIMLNMDPKDVIDVVDKIRQKSLTELDTYNYIMRWVWETNSNG